MLIPARLLVDRRRSDPLMVDGGGARDRSRETRTKILMSGMSSKEP